MQNQQLMYQNKLEITGGTARNSRERTNSASPSQGDRSSYYMDPIVKERLSKIEEKEKIVLRKSLVR